MLSVELLLVAATVAESDSRKVNVPAAHYNTMYHAATAASVERLGPVPGAPRRTHGSSSDFAIFAIGSSGVRLGSLQFSRSPSLRRVIRARLLGACDQGESAPRGGCAPTSRRWEAPGAPCPPPWAPWSPRRA
ncbi:hypothetical protein T492DRAFT_973180 [Pavlovales sp. CCMP2436]|nr:hypothetical protein T492DRAFT_973180 [Pavlovales sp. CCMP2436]